MRKKRVEYPEKGPTNTIPGTVVEALPNTLFRVELADTTVIIGYLSGKMRMHRIKVLVGDRVEMEPNPYGGKQRIVKRL